MRIAYFSPLPPKKTGIATYSHHLSRALAEQCDLDFFDVGAVDVPVPGTPIHDYAERPELLLELDRYDAILYHLGNNPHFHLDIYRALLFRPGVVVLHDAILYFLIAGLERGGMLREFLYNYGVDRIAEFFRIEQESPCGDVLRYGEPGRYPFVKRVLERAIGIVVHSETTAALVRSAGYLGAVEVIPHLVYPSMSTVLEPAAVRAIRAELGIRDGEVLLGCFGFIGPPKRLPVLFETLAAMAGRLDYKLLIVGEGDDIAPLVARYGLGDRVISEGFVDDERFQRLLKATDILVNLRYPSMGEASGPLSQAMAGGIPAIVSDHAWFAELPGDTVRKVGLGPSESADLARALLDLGHNADRRAAVAAAARAYTQRHCVPAVVARRYLDFIRGIIDAGASVSELDDRSALNGANREGLGSFADKDEKDWLRAYYDQRVRAAIGA
ncbi:MAG TPA: glycosyltransferase [Alphaproteobacteria bacterium]|nr:glycosyltransferase [Alphaproteobacteria bacterium]